MRRGEIRWKETEQCHATAHGRGISISFCSPSMHIVVVVYVAVVIVPMERWLAYPRVLHHSTVFVFVVVFIAVLCSAGGVAAAAAVSTAVAASLATAATATPIKEKRHQFLR